MSSRAGERSGKTCSSRPVSRSPTIALPSGSTTSPVGTARPEATTFGSPACSSPGPARRARPGPARWSTAAARPRAARPRAAGGRGRPGRSRRRRSRPATAADDQGGQQGGERPPVPPAASPAHSTCAAWADRLESAPVPTPGSSTPTSRCTSWCPPAPSATAVEALSPAGARPPRSTPTTAPRPGRPPQAQVWVPRSGGAALPDDGFLEALPRLRLVQLLSAGAEQFVGRLPEGVVLCNARGAHTPSTAEWAVAATLAAQRGHPVLRPRAGRPGGGRSTTHSSLVGARVLVVGAGDIGRRRSAGCWPASTSS